MTEQALRKRGLALFELALDLDEERREQLLRQECASDPALRKLVEALLALDARPHPILDSDGPELWVEQLAEESEGAALEPGTVVGPYRLVREAGRGGMATVYLAEREVGEIRQRVAVKLLKRGIDTDEVLRRFSQEARVLARLEHPGIARFHDAGASVDGLPYLAMEYVEGRRLTEYCDEKRLSLRGRLTLFGAVCDAVQFAHQQLVVHRDLKPSNILVDDRGDVKLLDFGIAKLLSDEPDASEPQTRTGLRILTPEYAAPEQVAGGGISTTTDVYALGVILHELLTGVRPSVSSPPTLPSQSIRTATQAGPLLEIAAARGTTPPRLVRALRGDLDRIVLRALEREPSKRYPAVSELRDDIERHLKGRPVLARPDTLGYRSRRFVRRHRAAVSSFAAATLVVAAVSVLYVIGIARERDVAAAEAAKAQATTEFLQGLLGEAYPSTTLGDSFSMTELLARAVARIDSLEAQPDVQAELLRTLGDVYREQGRFDDAYPLLERAVALHEDSEGLVTRAGGRALDALGHLQYEARDFEAALATHRQSLEVFERLYDVHDSLVLFALNNVAAAASALGDHEEALRLYRDVLDRSVVQFTDTSELVHTTYNNMGQLHHASGDYASAERELREAIRIRRVALPPDHPSLALSLNNLGAALTVLGRLDEAERAHRESLEINRRVFGPDHYRVALSAYNLALLLRQSKRFDEAERLLQVTIAIDRATYGPEHVEMGADLRVLGLVMEEKGDCEAARETLQEADRILELNGVAITHLRRLTARAGLGSCLTRLGRYEEAEAVLSVGFDAALSRGSDVDAEAFRTTAERLGELYELMGRPLEVERVRRLAPSSPG